MCNRLRAHPVIVLGLVILVAGCDSQGAQDEFAREASRSPSGFTRTTDGVEIIDEDPDDWRTAPAFRGRVVIEPAHPNPAPSDGFVTVLVRVTATNEIRGGLVLRAFRGTRFDPLDEIREASQPGTYAFTFSAALLGSTGLHRLFIFDGPGEIVSYGDLMIQ